MMLCHQTQRFANDLFISLLVLSESVPVVMVLNPCEGDGDGMDGGERL